MGGRAALQKLRGVPGLAQFALFSRLAHRPTWTLVTAVRRGVRRAPFAPAVVIAHASRDLAAYLDERATLFRGLQPTVLPGAPTLYSSILDHPATKDHNLSSLRLALDVVLFDFDGRILGRAGR